MLNFEQFLQKELSVSELEYSRLNVFRCEISQNVCISITVRQDAKLAEVPSKRFRDQPDEARSGNEPARPKEITSYKSAIGKMLFIGRVTQPIMLRIASHMSAKHRNSWWITWKTSMRWFATLRSIILVFSSEVGSKLRNSQLNWRLTLQWYKKATNRKVFLLPTMWWHCSSYLLDLTSSTTCSSKFQYCRNSKRR